MDHPPQTPERDERAGRFRRIFDEHHGAVLRYAIRRCGSRASAEDAAAEVFLAAWRRLDDVPADALPWLYGTARRVVANQRRGARRQEALLGRVQWESALAAQEGPLPDAGVLAGLARLPDGEREALLLVAWEGIDRRRAARAMGQSLPAFAARLHRARRRLAAELDRPPSPAPPVRIVPEEAS
jgi:DNA-directed RNA polymerase specialized sigma24 family protein